MPKLPSALTSREDSQAFLAGFFPPTQTLRPSSQCPALPRRLPGLPPRVLPTHADAQAFYPVPCPSTQTPRSSAPGPANPRGLPGPSGQGMAISLHVSQDAHGQPAITMQSTCLPAVRGFLPGPSGRRACPYITPARSNSHSLFSQTRVKR